MYKMVIDSNFSTPVYDDRGIVSEWSCSISGTVYRNGRAAYGVSYGGCAKYEFSDTRCTGTWGHIPQWLFMELMARMKEAFSWKVDATRTYRPKAVLREENPEENVGCNSGTYREFSLELNGKHLYSYAVCRCGKGCNGTTPWAQLPNLPFVEG